MRLVYLSALTQAATGLGLPEPLEAEVGPLRLPEPGKPKEASRYPHIPEHPRSLHPRAPSNLGLGPLPLSPGPKSTCPHAWG